MTLKFLKQYDTNYPGVEMKITFPIYTVLFIIYLFFFSCSSDKENKYHETLLNYPPELNLVKRVDWGWKPLQKTLPEHTITKITLHHGGVEFTSGKDPIEYIKNLQDWSRAEKEWIDIPYHYLIDLDGIIYEARPIIFPGDTNTDYDVRAHCLICVIGNYEIQTLSQKQLDAVVDLCYFFADTYDIPVSEIMGHKDYTETACPGQDLYKYIADGSIRSKVDSMLKSSRY
jgi:hypothetical protein